MTTSNSQLLSPDVVEAIRARRLFRQVQLMGYITKGGTYVVASPGDVTDTGWSCDLIAVLPGDLGHGRVVPLYIGTNPDTIAYLEQQLTRTDQVERPKACECIFSCADDPSTACSLSGEWHVHAGDPCPVHPDAPGDR